MTVQLNQPTIDTIKDILLDPNVPKFHANGFISATGSGDVLTIFQSNGQPTLVLNMSYNVAKSLAGKLSNLINDLEVVAEHEFLTTDELSDSIKKVGK